MATLKRKNADGNWDFLQLTGADVSNIRTDLEETKSQLASNMTQLKDISVNITKYKTGSNTWNDAFELAYADLPEFGGKILIPTTIEIIRPINLKTLGTKIVLIEGNSKITNLGSNYNSLIIKKGDFDGVVLSGGSIMRNIAVTRDTAYADTHDGIYVIGGACVLDNVQVSHQGGNGIRIGAKNDAENTVRYSANIGRFINVGSFGNDGWGIKVRDDFATGINTSDANALMFLAPDCRENKKGGILFEKCMDNQVYSADCEVNFGEAGIKIGEETSGITIYSSYTENPAATHDILLTADSKDSIVLGYRSGRVNDRITDLGVGNLVLGKYGAKFSGFYLKGAFNTKKVRIGDDVAGGYYDLFQNPATKQLDIVFGGLTENAKVTLKNASVAHKVGLGVGYLDINDRLNSMRVKPATVSATNVSATSSIEKTITTAGIKNGELIIANPSSALPSGISYYCYSNSDDQVKLTLVNNTTASVNVPSQTWTFLGVNMTALS